MGMYSVSLLYVGIAASLAILVMPAIGMGIGWWMQDRKARHGGTILPFGAERRDEEGRRAA